jgi:release factor glutamine methyltransferase
MMTYIEYYQDLLDKLSIQYDELEAKSIANIFFEDSLQITKTELIIHKDKTLSVEQSKNYEKGLAELISGQPIQYVVGFTYFDGLKILFLLIYDVKF